MVMLVYQRVHVMVIAMASQAFGLLLPPVALVRGWGVTFSIFFRRRWPQSSFDLVQGGTLLKIWVWVNTY